MADRDVEGWGPLCPGHRKRLLPSREGGTRLSAPIQKRKSAGEQVKELAIAYANAEEDSDYAKAERDMDEYARKVAEAKRTIARLERALERYGPDAIAKRISEQTKKALAELKAQGVRLGRPLKLDAEAARHLLKQAGSLRKAAALAGVGISTLQRALGRSKTVPVNEHGKLHGWRPPDDGDFKP